MRVYIVLLALTVFVAAVLTWKSKPKHAANDTKKWIESAYQFFCYDPIGKQIAQLAEDWNATAPEVRCKVRALLAESCRVPKNKTA
uniref:8 kDa glycoprotein n=1 Tax=Taenia hydatigena TaxID=85431 RepID=B6E4A9_TAEHY|nr:8 kDa glycoprotein [Taenia hydatigena]